MGWTVLYIAFGIVALWLLGEVLLQYKARLRWRVLAFTGFLGVVAGALIPSVIVIGVGIAAFATGQTFVTLSYRRGFAAGWALNGLPGTSRRRREEEEAEAEAELDAPPPFDELGRPEPAPAFQGQGGLGSDAFQPNALSMNGYGSDTFEANGYETRGFATTDAYSPNGYDSYNPPAYDSIPAYDSPPAYDSIPAYDSPPAYDNAPAYNGFGYEPGGYDTGQYQTTNGYGLQQPGQEQPVPVYQPGPLPDETGEFSLGGYDNFGYPAADQRGIYPEQPEQQQQYAAYSDPYYGYDGNSGYTGMPYEGYEYGGGYDGGYGGGDPQGYAQQQSPYGNGQDGFGNNGYDAAYGAAGTYTEQSYFPQAPTGGGGVWVPQQRDPNEQMQPGQEQPYPYDQNGYGTSGNGYYY